MHCEEPEGQAPAPIDIEQVTSEFPIYPGLGHEIVVDEVPGRPEDALVDVKRRIRETIISGGRS